ncbi:hypothetical protein GOP47_0008447 [Adiantum capillus-veneris]|uniref:Histidine kinase/HSP90-like ATPase domain-containing protein n=1 Tax=Adiantum capillus-veneris TaxID=13818 RepID=A0A9D4UZ38_ADICA|nr:hypothetical protein GOP47_0008447 [Adiantum capillus-veneris]
MSRRSARYVSAILRSEAAISSSGASIKGSQYRRQLSTLCSRRALSSRLKSGASLKSTSAWPNLPLLQARYETTSAAAVDAAPASAAEGVPPVEAAVPASDNISSKGKETPSAPVSGEKHSYQAEVSRLLDLIVHSLYSHKEVFLRELVSNASDALDKLRFLSTTDSSLMGSGSDLVIRIRADTDRKLLIITDSGIGMTKDELINSLGTIAQSGTANFVKALKENKDSLAGSSNLIGKFGVGFYSAFLVANKVAVSTKNPKSEKQWVWEAEADSSSFVIREETNPEFLIPRGTSIILHLKDDAHEYTSSTKIQDLVKNYSQFISFPIYVGIEKHRQVEVKDEAAAAEGKESTKTKLEKYYTYDIVNEDKPIWLRSPKEVTKEEYHAFFKKTYDKHLEPMAYTHFSTEGEVEFKTLLYIPGMAPIGADEGGKKNIKMYVKRVFISDDFHGELFPRYLSFMKGVVDSDDLPLNVSRELLQESRIVRLMRKRLIKKSFDLFDSLAKSSNKENYKRFYKNFGKYIKLGVTEDHDNKKRLATFLRYYSSQHQEEMTSLKAYVENMKPDQKHIYYFSSESVKSARNAPFLEQLNSKGYEVLFMTEPLDEVSVQHLKYFDGKKFIDISKETFDLGGDDEELKRLEDEYGMLCDWIKHQLGEKVARVEVSRRLASSPCVLVSGKDGWSANMERIMRAQNLGDTPGLREYMMSTRVFEINCNHPIIKDLDAARKEGKPGANQTADLLYEIALLSSGFVPEDPATLCTKIYELMSSGISSSGSTGSKTAASRPTPPPPRSPSVPPPPRSPSVTEAEILEPEVKPQTASA